MNKAISTPAENAATPNEDNLSWETILQAMTHLRQGDFSIRLPQHWTGVAGKFSDSFNEVVNHNDRLSRELERLRHEVGKEGLIRQRASLGGADGAWTKMETSVNALIDDLVRPTHEISRVIGAVAKGDLSTRAALEVEGRPLQGQFLTTAQTVNTMVEVLGSFAGEVTRVAREVGTEGKLGGQATVPGVTGTWKDLTDNVNSMASNLTGQVRNIAEVTTAVAAGDLSKKITVDVRGEILLLKETINTMVDQLRSFASEVTRVAREVGTEGKLGGQAIVPGVAGTWKDLTDNVNLMAANLTKQVRGIAGVVTAVARGDLTQTLRMTAEGEIAALTETINNMTKTLATFAGEVTRVAREVGTEGKLGGQAKVPGGTGTWKDLTDNVNSMASNLTGQVRNIAEVTTAVAEGDLSKKITVDVRGEILLLKETINTMVDQLRSFAGEVTRVAREVGTEGKLGGQAMVPGVAGTWKDLTDNVNSMASNLTGQVRNIAEVTTAVAEGDLSKKITVDVRGEILLLKETINTMVDQLRSFASEVTRVAREVGTEGKLGGQATVPGVAGTWKDLTDNVNLMAANLTKQVRGIAQVVTAVARGDLTRNLRVTAEGEIAELTETINNMINTLATFAAQVTSVAREVGVEGQLGGQANVPGSTGIWKDLTDNVNRLAANLTSQVRAIADVATAVTKGDLTRSINVGARGEVETLKDTINQMIANLRATTKQNADQDWLKTNLTAFTRMLQGQRDPQEVCKSVLSELSRVISARHGVFYVMENGPDEKPQLRLLSSYAQGLKKETQTIFRVGEGLVGECAAQKTSILLDPVPKDYFKVRSGLGFTRPRALAIMPALFEGHVKAVVELASFESFNDTQVAFLEELMKSIGIVLHTLESGLQTDTLLKHLQQQQEDLREANQNLEEKAELLARTSRFKSEFLSKMSHELRTPLNSMLILSQRLLDNPKDLNARQLEFCRTIHSSGGDLLVLINDILDLSKVESGTLSLDLGYLSFARLSESLERMFRPVAANMNLGFIIKTSPDLPASIYTDGKRVEQILRNLLSNAFKFTEKGKVVLQLTKASEGWSKEHPILGDQKEVIAMIVTDTGIGIPADKHVVIFEAFQQAESGATRKYSGTGLGLSISSELSKLLGGQLALTSSQQEKGSTFILYLPLHAPEFHETADNPDSLIKAADLVSRTPYREVSAKALAALKGRRALVVDDDIRNIFAMTSLLEDYGIKVVPAESGQKALDIIQSDVSFDWVLTDIMMPEMDGYDTIRAIRALKNFESIPIIAVTAKAMEKDLHKCMEAGATDYVTKPVNSTHMIALLCGTLNE